MTRYYSHPTFNSAQGNLKKWNKKVGDAIAPGDVLASIETDKAVVDFEMQEEGFVAALLYPEGTMDIELGKVVAIIVEDEADIAAFKDYKPGSGAAPTKLAAAAAAPESAPASTSSSSVSLPDHISLEMPNLSPTMEKVSEVFFVHSFSYLAQGNLKKWNKKVGDAIAPGDVLASIETDKAVVDFEMQEEGFVAALLYPEGTMDIELGKVVAIIVEDEADIAAFKDYKPGSGAAPTKLAAAAAAPESAPASTSPSAAPQQRQAASGDRPFISPLAKKMAKEKGIALD